MQDDRSIHRPSRTSASIGPKAPGGKAPRGKATAWKAGQFSIPHAHPCLAGHFPGHPLVPGVVLLDEVCAIIAATTNRPRPTTLEAVKFTAPVLPGQPVTVWLRHDGDDLRFSAESDGVPILRGVARGPVSAA
jgi:acyl dehydratase